MSANSGMHSRSSVGRANGGTPRLWFERARPGLGTFVRIGLECSEAVAHDAIEAAFAQIDRLHGLLSFHDPRSDVSRLNREAAVGRPIRVDPDTIRVLRRGIQVAMASDGAFDFTIAPEAVAAGRLPPPHGAPLPDPAARWSDVRVIDEHHVVFDRPLWLDLGGIAKGLAVDRAFDALAATAGSCGRRLRVDAGGDLRVGGGSSQRVRLDVPGHAPELLPQIELVDASLASSGPLRHGTTGSVAHWDGRTRASTPAGAFVSVVAAECALADALTKVVLARGAAAQSTLRQFGATAWLHLPAQGWQSLGCAT